MNNIVVYYIQEVNRVAEDTMGTKRRRGYDDNSFVIFLILILLLLGLNWH